MDPDPVGRLCGKGGLGKASSTLCGLLGEKRMGRIPARTIVMSPSCPASEPVNGVPGGLFDGFGGFSPAIGVTKASSSSLTTRPGMSSPTAVPVE